MKRVFKIAINAYLFRKQTVFPSWVEIEMSVLLWVNTILFCYGLYSIVS